MNKIFLLILFFVVSTIACNNGTENRAKKKLSNKDLTGEILVFHAGSLSVPFREMKSEFEKLHSEVKVLLEPSGSVVCARKITDLKRECGIMASADYKIINKMLIPEYADTCYNFASNEMVIAYNDFSKYSSDINSNNWPDILLKKDVIFGRAEPNNDPCGYRTILMWQLAEIFYKKPDITKKLLKKDIGYIRPKAIDLLALLDAKATDYVFEYRSVAQQHKLKYIILSDSINLKNPEFSEFYKNAEIKIRGNKKDEDIIVKGGAMIYGITLLKNAPNKKATQEFFNFILSETGSEILRKHGQVIIK